MIMKRDQELLDALEDFQTMTTGQIYKLYYNNVSDRYTRKKLAFLVKEKYIKRCKSAIDNSFAYYLDKRPGQLRHFLYRSQAYTFMKDKYNILEWNNKYQVEHVRPDAFCYIEDHGVVFPVFIEIHLGRSFDYDKYTKLHQIKNLQAMYGMVPRIVIFSDTTLNLPHSTMKYRFVDIESMKGLDSILK